ncbi:MAG: hypothetical protein IPK53_11915 [bacterium]|nr:hypothetical protein [bacterium]MBK8129564.1 hypothetical protein [bacterium]
MKHKLLLILALVISLVWLTTGCEDDEDNATTQPSASTADCYGCHTNQEMLEATAAPDTSEAPENPGEG